MGRFGSDASMQPSGRGRGFWNLLPDEDRRVLWSLGRDKEYPPGATLCVEGDPATHVFILLDGWVKVISVSGDGHQSIDGLRGAGDIVGETAGETTGNRNATLQAIVTVRALIVGFDRFSSFLDTHQGGSRAYRRVMVYRWRDAEMMLRIRAVTSGAQRLAGLLLGLAERLGSQADGVVEITLPLSQDELASLAGTSRATVARALNGWRKRGLLRTGQRRITLIDVPGLHRAAGPHGSAVARVGQDEVRLT
jgi:CRP/FNR family cyclic AMP-dependent transcriptional regulator